MIFILSRVSGTVFRHLLCNIQIQLFICNKCSYDNIYIYGARVVSCRIKPLTLATPQSLKLRMWLEPSVCFEAAFIKPEFECFVWI